MIKKMQQPYLVINQINISYHDEKNLFLLCILILSDIFIGFLFLEKM